MRDFLRAHFVVLWSQVAFWFGWLMRGWMNRPADSTPASPEGED